MFAKVFLLTWFLLTWVVGLAVPGMELATVTVLARLGGDLRFASPTSEGASYFDLVRSPICSSRSMPAESTCDGNAVSDGEHVSFEGDGKTAAFILKALVYTPSTSSDTSASTCSIVNAAG